MRLVAQCPLVVAGMLVASASLRAQEPAPIQDNSFLVEEAYNQESGVVQHVSTFARAEGGSWEYAFTQEWPLGGIRHQLSYTVPFLDAGAGTGLGDVAVNYRFQAAGGPAASFVAAPRVGVMMPSGSETMGRGTGAVALEASLPLSLVLGRRIVAHLNAGGTITPSAHGIGGTRATTTGVHLGASAVWLARPNLNLLVESIWVSDEEVTGAGTTARVKQAFLNPGIRLAFNAGRVQVVPGVAYTIGIGPSSGSDALFVYLSLEHAFRGE
jgi:hypothetical protein